MLKDPTFKRYAVVVDRALSAFDTIVEWPDYIAFLGRLLKVTYAMSRINLGSPSVSYMSSYPVKVDSVKSPGAMPQPVASVRCASENTRGVLVHLFSSRGKPFDVCVYNSKLAWLRISKYGCLVYCLSLNTLL
jgi:Dopey, N-terminal